MKDILLRRKRLKRIEKHTCREINFSCGFRNSSTRVENPCFFVFVFVVVVVLFCFGLFSPGMFICLVFVLDIVLFLVSHFFVSIKFTVQSAYHGTISLYT